ncbi:adenosylcobinamide-GDP ribazoletransferase [Phenylobacterium sp.]|uniref:adenosylcobinamide-GDP ribazoletransferase n=1 Tax=Phenylobacterium sp. TaxID=1871053 RepID=UPI00272FE5FA|nr:adenosylcobinamide-GDP ribazoletransferase [Phenylobacterium sp.]MDP1600769.1 adenosylcobinamide-GDP ribazoletransferase [Phenylobacterium sp.]MDP3594667.1 adenosylcobinamide-GDP ribazoletransferase [Phenylobacterium sp.]
MSRLSHQFQLFLCAVQFLTRIPTPALRDFQPDWISRSARYFPLVGLLVGGGCAAVFWSASLIWSGWLPALLAIAAGVLITGAFHEDGLADTADGLGGGTTVAKRLTIMKDSRIGTYGALALGLTLAIKAAALATLPAGLGAWTLVAAHGAGRGASVLAMRALPYVGDAKVGKWKPSPADLSLAEVLTAVAVAGLPLALSPDGVVGLAILIGAILALAVSLIARRLLGGYTGDVLGAIEQVFELGFVLGVAASLGVANTFSRT